MAMDQLAAQIFGMLEERGIPALLLKGAPLALWLYPEGHVRNSADIDVLVPPSHVEAAGSVLAANGWRPGPYPSPLATAWTHPQILIPVDLHRSFHFVTVSDERCWEILSHHASTAVVGGRALPVPSGSVAAALLVLHATEGLNYRGQEELSRAIAMSNGELWRRAATVASALGATDAFGASLRQSVIGSELAASLGIPMPTTVSTDVGVQLLALPRTTYGLVRLEQARGWSLVRALALELVPPPARVYQSYTTLARTKPGLVLAYVLWPAGVLRNLPRGWRGWRRLRLRPDIAAPEAGSLERTALVAEVVGGYVRCRWLGVATVAGDVESDRSKMSAAAEVAVGRRLALVAERVLGYLPGGRGAVRARVVVRMLAARGIPATVVTPAPLEDSVARAWVEVQGTRL